MGLQFDEDAANRVEAIYSTPDVVAQREAVLHALELRPGERVLDVGSGPGFLAAEMAAVVGASGRVRGIDISESMVTMSQRRCATLSHVEFRVGNATQLPFPDASLRLRGSVRVSFQRARRRGVSEPFRHRPRRPSPGERSLRHRTYLWTTLGRSRSGTRLWKDKTYAALLPSISIQ